MNAQAHLGGGWLSRTARGKIVLGLAGLLVWSLGSVACAADAAPDNIGAVTENAELALQVRKETALALLKEARALKEELRYLEAEKKLDQALRYDAALTDAQVELDFVRFQLGRLPGERAETTRKIVDDQKLIVEQAQAQLQRLFAEGEGLLAQKRYEQALEKFTRVIEIDSYNAWNLNMPDLVTAARAQIGICTRLLEDQKVDERRKVESELRARADGERTRDLKYTENLIRQYKGQAREALAESKFDKAELFAHQILELDPRDAEAQEIRDKARYLRHLFAKDKIERETRRNGDLVLRGILDTTVPYHHIFQFPPRKVWEKLGKQGISLEEQVASEEPVANRDVRRVLETTKIQRISFEDRPLREALDYLSQIAGVSFVPNNKAREAMEGDELKVNLAEVQGLMLKNVLDIVLEGVGEGYGYQVQNGAVVIGPRSSLSEKMYLQFYAVDDIANSHPDFPAPPMSVNLSTSNDRSNQVVLDNADAGAGKSAPIGSEELVQLIVKRIFGGKEENGTAQYQTGKLVVRTSLENHRKINELLESLRKLSGVLVACEARFIDIQDNMLEEIGVSVGGPVESSLEYPIPDVNGLGTSVASGYTFLDQGMRYETRAANISDYSGVLGTEVTPFNITPQGGMALQWNVLQDYQLEAIMTMVQKKQKSRSLDAPRVIAFDSQTAHTMVIDQIAYIKDVDVNQTGVSPVINPLIGSFRVGSLLEIRPTVTFDRKFVILEVKPTTANHIDSKYADLSLAQGYTMVSVELPVILLAQIKTTITVPDGGSVLVGGLKKVVQQEKSIGIPLIQRIPILNILFGRRGQTQLRNNLFVMIKSNVVIVKEEEQLNFP